MGREPQRCVVHDLYALPVCWKCHVLEVTEARKAHERKLEHGEQITLEKIDLGCSVALSDIEVNTKRADTVDRATEQAIAMFRSYVLGMPGEEIHLFWPSTWADAFRVRFFPGWLQKWFPVKWTEVREKRFEKVFVSLYPEQITRIEGRADAIE